MNMQEDMLDCLLVTHVYLCPGATMCGAPSYGKTNQAGGIADCVECIDRLNEAQAQSLIDEGFFKGER